MNTVVKSQIRMSEELHSRIMRIASRTGDSLNGTMLHLLDIALKYYESESLVADVLRETWPCSRS